MGILAKAKQALFGKPKKRTQNESAIARIKRAEVKQNTSLEEALSSEELKKLGFTPPKKKGK